MDSRSFLIRPITLRPPSSTSVCVMLARNAACVLLNTAINASTMSDINTTTTRISTRVKAEQQRRRFRWYGVKRAEESATSVQLPAR